MRNSRQVLYPDDVADSDIVIPGKKTRAKSPEWKLQAAAVKLVRAKMRVDKDLRYITPMAEAARTPQRAAIAKMMGLQRGVPDMWLMRPREMCIVEFKTPLAQLNAEQLDWFAWFSAWGIACHRCDSLDQFRAILAAF